MAALFQFIAQCYIERHWERAQRAQPLLWLRFKAMMSALGLGRNKRAQTMPEVPESRWWEEVHQVCIVKEAHPVENKQGSREVKQSSERISPMWFWAEYRPQAYLKGTRDMQLESRHHTAALCTQVLPKGGWWARRKKRSLNSCSLNIQSNTGEGS